MSYSKKDSTYMARCLELAYQAEGDTAPNPMVGSVVVDKNGTIVGSGYHHASGTPHAEIHALNEAGDKARDGTIYVSLEPCSHFGKTPPCVDTIIKANIKRVVVATADPNPKVNGAGLAKLKDKGIEVTVGPLEKEAKWLNRAFFKRVSLGMPWISLKIASTLDGRIADRYGNSKWITGDKARAYVQSIRKKSDCILVGAGTLRADNPHLNVRDLNTIKQPLRAVIDPSLSVEQDSNFINPKIGGQSLIYHAEETVEHNRAKLKKLDSVNLIPVKLNSSGNLDLEEILQNMAARGINSVLCEGGSTLASRLLVESLVDEIYWFIAPKLLPDSKALSSTRGESPLKMEDLLNFESIETLQFGEDTLLHLKK